MRSCVYNHVVSMYARSSLHAFGNGIYTDLVTDPQPSSAGGRLPGRCRTRADVVVPAFATADPLAYTIEMVEGLVQRERHQAQ